MNVLWLYKYIEDYSFDDWLHMKFAEFIASEFSDITLKAYGPGLTKEYPKIAPLKYRSVITMDVLHEWFPFDIVVLNTKSRMFEYYDPHNNISKSCWLPPDFREWPGPKVMIEEDYHYEVSDQWYQEMGIRLILQRHLSQVARQSKVPMQWFPFSVDTSVFFPTGKDHRENKIAFLGSLQPRVYKFRHGVIERLAPLDLVANFQNNIQMDGKYIQALRKYVGYLSCGSIYEICAAKNFEIMASGGVLFTNLFTGIDKLFDPDCYVSYSNDFKDAVSAGQGILKDPLMVRRKVCQALKCIKGRHTYRIRTGQLFEILKGVL